MIYGIQSADIREVWEDIAPYIEKPLKKMQMESMYSPDDVMEKCRSREWQCWVAAEQNGIDAVFITKIDQFPAGLREFFVILIGGHNISKWVNPAWDLFKAFARENGCGRIRGIGRAGWVKVLAKFDKVIVQHDTIVEI